MSRLEDVLRRISKDLEEKGARFALVGGLAVSARTEPRFTRDVDLAVAAPGDPAAEAIVAGLRARGYRPVATVEQESAGRMAQVRLAPPGEPAEGAIVDLLFASSGIEREIVDSAEPLEVVKGLRIPVAVLGHLLALKVLSRDDRSRPQDAGDLAALLSVARPADRSLAASALALIEERGFGRGRSLVADYHRLAGDPDGE